MPELPEVEVARRALERWLVGRRVERAEADATRVFRGADRAAFARLAGLTAREVARRGKYLLLTFGQGARGAPTAGLLAHLGMTGKFVLRPRGVAEPYSRARLVLERAPPGGPADGAVVHLRDPRLFGRLEPAAPDALWRLPAVAALGRDPLVDGLTWQQLRDAVAGSRSPLKVALMDQGRVAGLGNIHAAEALFRAGLHPARAPASLSDAEWRRLTAGIHAALAFGLEEQLREDEPVYLEDAGSLNPFLVYGRGGGPCGRCGARVEAFAQGGRTTHACPRCQPRRPPARGARAGRG